MRSQVGKFTHSDDCRCVGSDTLGGAGRTINLLANSRAKKFKAMESLSKIQYLDLEKLNAAAFNVD